MGLLSELLPAEPGVWLAVGIIDALVIASGWLIPRLGPRALQRVAGWTLAVAVVVAMDQASADEHPAFRMLAICAGLLHAMKGLTHIEYGLRRGRPLPVAAFLGYTLLSFGMQPSLLERKRSGLPTKRFWMDAALAIAIGLAVLLLAMRLHAPMAGWRLDAWPAALTTAALLLGISLVFHFGVFRLVAAAWRQAGYPARLAFRAPLAAKSLTEFWSARWNLPFVEMTALTVFKPLRATLGATGASLLAFAVSGVLHEVAISLPVNAGYGKPLIYFAIHGLLMRLEAILEVRGLGPSRWGVWAHAWVLLALALPLPLCFHAAFLEGVLPG